MARTNESAIQRLQVGLVGLIVVLLFVSVASMILDGADDPARTAAAQAAAKASGAPNGKDTNEEPLVELGVTPVVPDQSEKQTFAQPASGAPQN
jgi:hypothetical protein